MAEAVAAYEFGRRPELRIRYGSAGCGKSRQAAVRHFLHLADTLDTHSAALFNDYIG